MTSLALDFAETEKYIAVVCGWNRDSANWDTTQDADAEMMIRSGQRAFLTAHDWSFLNGILFIETNEPYTTGTIAVNDGAVTGSGTTFPSWATDAWLEYGGKRYAVSVRGGDTSLTLESTSNDTDASAGTTYTLRRYQYELPDDYAGLSGELVYDPNQLANYRITSALWEQLRSRQAHTLESQAPRYYAIYPLVFDPDDGQQWRIMFDPVPDAVYEFRGRYRKLPAELNSTDDTVAGGAVHSETLLESILSAAENFYHDNPSGPHTIRYKELLARSIEQDKTIGSALEIPRRCRTDEEWRRATSSMRGNYIGLTDY